MRLLAVNAAPLAPMLVQGDEVRTGFDKKPLVGPIKVVPEGILGDERGACSTDMNRAIFLYQSRYYDEWCEELARALPFGTFGENLTFDGPPDSEMYLGDLLQVGSVRLRITQPRFPCRKMTVRIGEGDDFPLRYLRSGRLGFFCTVVEPGETQAGDEIRVIRRASTDPITLSEFARVTYLEPNDQTGLERLLASSELVPEWRIRVERLLRRAQGPAGGWHHYRPLVVSRRHRLSSEVVELQLHDPSGQALPAFDAGQFLTLSLELPSHVRPVVRTYTLAGRTDDHRGYKLAIKREVPPADRPSLPAGLASSHLHDGVNEAETLMALSPRGHFLVEPGSRQIVLLSAGIGVTPMLAMLAQLATCPLRREVLFVHGARSSSAHVYAKQVRDLVASSKFLRSHVLYSKPNPDDVRGHDYDSEGRLTTETLEGLLPSLNADYYVCGPVSFMRDIVRGLLARGVPKDQIRYEFFGAGVSLLENEVDIDALPDAHDADGRPVIVTFARTGISIPWKQGMFSILSLAERSGIRPDASCRTGLCGICTCRINSGEVHYAVEPLEKPSHGEVMICCAQPTTSIMLDL